MIKTITALLLCMSSLCAMADETSHAIDIRTDKIIINTDSLGLPKSTTVYEILSLLPDLSERSKDFAFQNYTIQINGKTVGDARDAVLEQIRLSDLKWIEVSRNSLSAISAQGQGGSISLELRPATEGLTGAVNANVSTEQNYAGGLRLDDQKGKWTFRGVATVENYVPAIFNSHSSSNNNVKTDKQRDFSEYVSTFIEYRPTKADLFKFHVSEVYTNSRQWLNNNSTIMTTGRSSRTRNTNVFGAVNYEHSLPTGGKLSMEVNYRYIPEKKNTDILTLYKSTADNTSIESSDYTNSGYNHKAHNVYGEFKLEQPLIKPTTTTTAKMELALQYNYNKADNSSDGYSETFSDDKNTSTDAALSTIEHTYYLRPYVKLEARFNKWQFMGIVDYQHFSYETHMDGKEDNVYHRCEDITGQFVAIYTPNSKNLLRLRFVRSIDRPTSKQMFPYSFIDPEQGVTGYTITGNADLVPGKANSVDLDYCLNLSTTDYHLELKAGVEYSHAYDRVYDYVPNTSIAEKTYLNMQNMDVVIGDLGIYFRKGIFSTWFSGNIYFNYENDVHPQTNKDIYTNHYTYYNLLLRPAFNLHHGWLLSANLTFNSPITQDISKESSLFYGGIRIGKTWRHLNAYIYGVQNFLGDMRTTYTTSNDYTDSEHMHSSIGAGLRYSF